MPQMMPMNWLMLMMYFILFYYLILIVNYYMISYTPSKDSMTHKKLIFFWKW